MDMRILPSIALLTCCLSLDLRAAGELDTSFNPNANGEIKAVAVAPDGNIMIGGAFTNVGGRQQAGVTRLLPTGQPDLTWIPPTTAADVQTCAVFEDGSVAVVAPYFQRTSVCRLKSNGSIDGQFEVRLSNGEVRAMSVDIDGNLLLGGNFNMPSGSERRGYAVVEPSGEVRGKYYAFLTQGKSVNTLVARSDRSVIMGGDFSQTYGGTGYANLQRMTSGALLDSEYRPPLAVAEGKSVDCLAFQHYEIPWIIAGGSFNVRLSATVTETRCLARFSTSGSRDSTFNPVFTRPNGVPRVRSVVVQSDGKIIAAGDFTAVNGVARLGLVRLNTSGSVDTTFVVKDATGVTGLALQADGKVLVTGTFQQLSGVTRNRIARLNNDGVRDSLGIRQNEITWARVGSMPDSDLVSFEVSSDAGETWQMLKAPTRGISATWRVSGINLPASGMIRARARVSSGLMNGSSGISETVKSYSIVPEISVRWRPEGLSWISLTDGQAEALDYGEIREGSPVTKSFSISNTGLYELNVMGVQLPVGFTLVDSPLFPLTLGVQKSVTFGIRADASAHGTIDGTAIVTSDDADESSFEFPLTVKVVGPEIAMRLGDAELSNEQTNPVSFAQGYQGTQQLRETVVITNEGTGDLNVSAISAGAGFTVDKPQPFLLQPGESRAIKVGPDQSIAGPLTGNLEVFSDDLDEPVFRVPLEATVVSPLVTKVVNARTTLNRKTGLREQKLRITNTTKTVTVGGFRVIVRGLPEGVQVRNASDVLPDGSVVIEVHKPLGKGGKFVFVLEYEVPKGAPTVIHPQLTTEVIFNSPKAAAALAVEKCERTCDGHFALSFRSVPGRLYQVEYSADGKDWKASKPTRAAGSIVRWVDCGCPYTECAPKDAPTRLYRVRELE